MEGVKELFFYVSGEHETLPQAEIKAILEGYNLPYRNTAFIPRFLCFESDVKCLSIIAKRSCFTKICGVVILKCAVDKEAIFREIGDIDYNNFIKKEQTFSVKIKTITKQVRDTTYESMIGKIILKKVTGVKVKLEYPDVNFFGVVSDNIFILGQNKFELRREFLKKKLNQRPFNHPAALTPKFARLLVNLARTKPEYRVLDPFCGTGSILIEASSTGSTVLGLDIDPEMIKGTADNLRYFKVLGEGLIISDSRHIPIRNVDRIVTDPPYGRASSTHGLSTKELVKDFLIEAMNILPRGGYLSIVLPDTLNAEEIGRDLGYINVERHTVREHKSLRREITVIQKP